MLKKTGNKPKTGIGTLQQCESEIYQSINLLLKNLRILPFSMETPERKFSAIKRVKTYFPNTMSEVSNLEIINIINTGLLYSYAL